MMKILDHPSVASVSPLKGSQYWGETVTVFTLTEHWKFLAENGSDLCVNAPYFGRP